MFLNFKTLIIDILENFKLTSNVMLVASKNRKKFVFYREDFSQSVKWMQDSDLNYCSRRIEGNRTIWAKAYEKSSTDTFYLCNFCCFSCSCRQLWHWRTRP